MLRCVIASEIVTSSPAARASAPGARFAILADPGARIWLGLVLYALVYSIWRNLAGLPGLGETLANRAAFVVPSVLVTLLAIRAARTAGIDDASRRAWRLLAAAFACIGVGYALWLTGGQRNLGHIGWLLYYPVLAAGILSFPRVTRSRTERLQFAIDTASVVCGGGMLLIYILAGPGARALSEPTAISLAYPAGDLVLLMSVAVLGRRRRDEPARLAFLLLTTELLVEFGGDIAYGATAITGGPRFAGLYDSAYMLGHVLRGAAALVYARRAGARVARPAADGASGVSLLPYGFALLGYLVLLLDLGAEHPVAPRALAGCAVLLTVLVLLSQWITAFDNVRLQARAATRRSEARFRTLVQNASDLIAVVDEHGRVAYVAPSAEGLLAHDLETLPHEPFSDIVHPDDVPRARVFLAHAALQPGVSGPCELRVAAHGGRWLAMEAVATNLLSDPEISGIVLTLRDISERKRLEEQLLHRALHDPLTGLANRALFGDRLRHAHALARESGRRYAVAVADLDDFKGINDGLGHATGDQVLIQVARRTREAVRAIDTTARLGGDEFAILFEDAEDEAAILAATANALDSIARPIELGDLDRGPLRLTACMGLALSAPGVDEDEVLRQADLALYHAKEHGKGRLVSYVPGMQSEILRRHHLESALRDAIAREELHLLYQPVVSLAGGRISGVEALVRWRHPERGLVPPSDFIDLAESTGLIEPLGRWVLAHACTQGARWSGGAPFTLGINLSVRQLLEPGIVADVREALRASGLPPEQLVLEITETLLATDALAAAARLHELKALGVRLALDDFGIGYSSLGRLRELPIDILKIDGTFSRDLASREGITLMQAIVYLGKALGLQVIGEGVETAEQAGVLKRLGCDFAQGYHFGRPVEAAEIDAALAAG